MYTCECGKSFEKMRSFHGHLRHCQVYLKDRYIPEVHGNPFNGKRGWAKGLTKETDVRVKKFADTLKYKHMTGILIPNFKGKHHSDVTKAHLASIGKYNASHHKNGWKAGDSRIQNKYEQYAQEYLQRHNIVFIAEKSVSTHRSKGALRYQVDFLINDKIVLELDGSGHNYRGDAERDKFLISQGYIVYHIRHLDSIEILDLELNKFITEFLPSCSNQ